MQPSIFCRAIGSPRLLWLILGPLFMLPGVLPAQQNLQEGFVGRKVMATTNLPAASSGLRIYYRAGNPPEIEVASELAAEQTTEFGIGVETGEIAEITAFRVRDRHIEVHLNGGGVNQFTAALAVGMNQGQPTGVKKMPGGSRINLRFPDRIERISLSAELVEDMLSRALVLHEEEFAVQKEILAQQAQSPQESANSQREETAANLPPPADLTSVDPTIYVAPRLRSNASARAVAKFLLGYIHRNFDYLASDVYTFARERNRLLQSLPTPVAQQRYTLYLDEQRKAFATGNGPFFLQRSRDSLHRLLPYTTQFLVTEIKANADMTVVFMSGADFQNAFVEVSYPHRATAPEVGRGRRLKKAYLVVPVASGMVRASPMRDPMMAPPGALPEVGMLVDGVEFWQ